MLFANIFFSLIMVLLNHREVVMMMLYRDKIEKQVRDKLKHKYDYAKLWGYSPMEPDERKIKKEVRKKLLANNLI